jgi:hypothetical protein
VVLRERKEVNWEECGVAWHGPLFLCWYISGSSCKHRLCSVRWELGDKGRLGKGMYLTTCVMMLSICPHF